MEITHQVSTNPWVGNELPEITRETNSTTDVENQGKKLNIFGDERPWTVYGNALEKFSNCFQNNNVKSSLQHLDMDQNNPKML